MYIIPVIPAVLGTETRGRRY